MLSSSKNMKSGLADGSGKTTLHSIKERLFNQIFSNELEASLGSEDPSAPGGGPRAGGQAPERRGIQSSDKETGQGGWDAHRTVFR